METNNVTIFNGEYTNENFSCKVNMKYDSEERIADIINMTFSHIVTVGIIFKNQGLLSDIGFYPQWIIELSRNKMGHGQYNPVYSSAEKNLHTIAEQFNFGKITFKIKKADNDNFTTTFFDVSPDRINGSHYLLSVYALAFHAFKRIDEYSWKEAKTLGELLSSSKFLLYKKCVDSLEHIGFSLTGCIRVITEQEGNSILNGVKKYLSGQKDKLTLFDM
ncbi:MAG: hypothetical protein D4R64_06205 [Porphyromonadaceae bacterium]|nr:MAG: hypothetical protein D4R64_06205 [Porphyromonadaceae bacterium]